MIENTIINKNKSGEKANVFGLTFPSLQLVELAAHAGFDAINCDGEHGLFSPESIAELVGYELLSEFSFSEIRANYALFTVLGLLALISIYYNNLAKGTYFVYIVIFASFIQTSIIVAILAELLVVGLCIWRIQSVKRS